MECFSHAHTGASVGGFFLACAKECENVESLLWLCKKLAYAWHVCVGTCFFRGVHLVVFLFLEYIVVVSR